MPHQHVSKGMKRISSIFAVLTLLILPQLAFSQNKNLAKVKEKIAASKSMETAFTINGGAGPVQGSATLAADRYTMFTPQLKVWFDGRTQWTLLESTGEVSITEPTADELMASNPFAILSASDDYYKVSDLNPSNGIKRLLLTPKDKTSPISSITLGIASNDFPAFLKIELTSGERIEVNINSMAESQAKPVAFFRYDPNRYPAQEVIDLR